MYSPTPPTGAFLLAGLIDPLGKLTCMAGPFERSTGGEFAASFVEDDGVAEGAAQAEAGILSTSLAFFAPHDHLREPRASVTLPAKSLGTSQEAIDEVGVAVEAEVILVTTEDTEVMVLVTVVGEGLRERVVESVTVDVKSRVCVIVTGSAVLVAVTVTSSVSVETMFTGEEIADVDEGEGEGEGSVRSSGDGHKSDEVTRAAVDDDAGPAVGSPVETVRGVGRPFGIGAACRTCAKATQRAKSWYRKGDWW